MADNRTKNRNKSSQASLVHMKYLTSLMDMNSRSTCPKCEGNLTVFDCQERAFCMMYRKNIQSQLLRDANHVLTVVYVRDQVC